MGATTKTRDPVTLAQPHARLLGRYGTASAEVLALADGRPDLLEPVVAGLPYIGAEVVYAAREEMAGTLDDVLSRRTRAMIQRAEATMEAATAVAELIAPDMGWDQEEVGEQVARFTEACQKELLTAGLDLP
jgi:glycerol-3-phosphate dehydrogenase